MVLSYFGIHNYCVPLFFVKFLTTLFRYECNCSSGSTISICNTLHKIETNSAQSMEMQNTPTASLQWGLHCPNECPAYGSVQFDADMGYPLIAIVPSFTLILIGSALDDPIYGSNRTVWYLNWMQQMAY